MDEKTRTNGFMAGHAARWPILLAGGLLLLGACSSAPVVAPEPRTLVNRNGARLMTTQPAMQQSYEWVTEQVDEIQQNPTFLVATTPATADVLPWETLEVSENGDTARVQYQRAVPALQQVYQIYAHLHIVKARDEVGAWIPDAEGLEGWDLEVAIVDRTTEAWLLGRASYDFPPYPPMDQLIYAQQAGQLEPLLLSLRGYEFPEARDAWLAEHPDGEAEFRDWYRDTFGEDPDPIGGDQPGELPTS